MAKKSDYDIIDVDHWEVPENPIEIIAMPNIPLPLHNCNPRNLLGSRTWNLMRKTCYRKAHDTCEICGHKPEDLRARHSHEVYDIDYKNHTATFKRCVCVCKRCHLLCIHTGRALTLFKHNNAVFTADKLIEGAEHAFTIISSFNGGRQGEPPLRAFSTWLEYLKEPELKPRMEELIKKYDIKFYDIPSKSFNKANWSKWKLIIGNREYPTPFKNQADWEEKMAENNKKGDREAVDNFKGGIFDEINEILKNNID